MEAWRPALPKGRCNMMFASSQWSRFPILILSLLQHVVRSSVSYPLWALGQSLSLANCHLSHLQPLQPMVTSSLLLLRVPPLWHKTFLDRSFPTIPRPGPSLRSSGLTRTLWPPFPTSTQSTCAVFSCCICIFAWQFQPQPLASSGKKKKSLKFVNVTDFTS